MSILGEQRQVDDILSIILIGALSIIVLIGVLSIILLTLKDDRRDRRFWSLPMPRPPPSKRVSTAF